MKIELEAHPAVMGWAIIAKCDGELFMVESGLKSPVARLKYWRKNLPIIEAAIMKTAVAFVASN